MNGDPYNSTGDRAVPKNVVKMPGAKSPPAQTEKKSWWMTRVIARLGGQGRASHIPVSPLNVAAATLEKAQAGRIKTVMVSIEWDDGSYSSDWCQMPRRCLLGHAFNIQTTVQDEIHTP